MLMVIVVNRCTEHNPYLEETAHLDFNNPIFDQTCERLVTDDLKIEDKLARLFYFTRDSIPFASEASLQASEALKKNQALCYTKAMIFVSFCRKLGVPAKLAVERFRIRGDLPDAFHHYHGIVKIYINGKWIYIDTVSNDDAWFNWWARNKQAPFEAPAFSLEEHVVVDSAYIADLIFEDFETNGVPDKWLEDMRRYIKTGQW